MRMSEINHRLVEISNGAAQCLIRQVHEAESSRETCIVGLDWSFALDDLLEIVRVSLIFPPPRRKWRESDVDGLVTTVYERRISGDAL